MSFITKYILLGSAADYTRYAGRVSSNGGSIRNSDIAKKIIKFYKDNQKLQDIRLLVAPELGMTLFNDGTDLNVSKLYSVDSTPNDVSQTTANSQPYLAGDIAPTEKYSLNNPNGASRYMTHPTISYSSSDKWSITYIANINGIPSGGSNNVCGKLNTSRIGYLSSNNQFRFTSETSINNVDTISALPYIGKNTVVSYVANNGNLKMYINGILQYNANLADTSFVFERLLHGRFDYFLGKLHFYKIQNGEANLSFIKSEYDMLRSIFPEIESVQIGTQNWATSNFEAVATPQGNIIPEMQASSNVEKVVNGTFDTNIVGWSAVRCNITWNSGQYLNAVQNQAVNDTFAILQATISPEKWYKITFKAKSSNITGTTPSISVAHFSSVILKENPTYTTDWQNYEYYGKSLSSSCVLYLSSINVAPGTSVDIDDISIKEVGWANSTELYDAIYAATSGTAAQKEYAALKAAAMWCHYTSAGNDADRVKNGAIYSKLYNWYAVKLLQTDIDLYNTASPTNRWGWHVPTQAEFTTLQTYSGDASVAGGKLKKEGLTYFNSPNTGATNESWFSAIGGGYRDGSNGEFYGLKNVNIYIAIDNDITDYEKRFGNSLRLIKD